MFSELPFDSTSEFKQFLPIGYREYTYHSSLKERRNQYIYEQNQYINEQNQYINEQNQYINEQNQH